ncbi:hypothetical protein [Chthonobacter albigriseus]|uniref:hypothetical protein n=1 Tax=Chthonobacter albigriseus TaxID=1683161 RepID=UPI0015EED5CC|nr:hypothetical protein [Chthonobacter albigriseus]
MPIESTTSLFINGDLKLNPIQRARYYWHHYRRNIRENGPPLAREIYWPPTSQDCEPTLDKLTFNRTPTRLLCNIFWSLVDWKLLAQEMGPLRIHDMGCGSGRYGLLIREAATVPVSYHGFDIAAYDSWDGYSDENTKMSTFDGQDFASTFFEKPNLFITQSALEHIPGDLTYFKAAAEYCSGLDKALQIHMVPPSKGLWQWGPHGWRQYNRTMLRKFEAALPPGMTMTVFCLGGGELVKLHRKWAHRRFLVKKIKKDPVYQQKYKSEWIDAIDRSAPVGVDEAAFLAIVVEKGFSPPMWQRLLKSRR